jgi:hypothetical protein
VAELKRPRADRQHRIAPPGVPGLLVDEAPGMRQALEHLVVRHGCRRIAFIRGPSVNAEAEHRYAIYRTVLEERGLEFDPNLVCEGTFEKSAGEAAVQLLVDERKVQFDALSRPTTTWRWARSACRNATCGPSTSPWSADDIEDAPRPADDRAPAAVSPGRSGLDLCWPSSTAPSRAATTAATELVVRQSCGPQAWSAPPRRTVTQTRPRSNLLPNTATISRARSARAVHGADAALPWADHRVSTRSKPSCAALAACSRRR